MRIRHALPLSVAALAVLMSGCAEGRHGGGGNEPSERADASSRTSRPSASAGDTRPWEPDDASRRAERALDAAADDGTEPEPVDSGTAYLGSGLDKSFPASGKQPYRFEITCDTDGVAELTLTLSRGEEEQPYGVECGDLEADRFDLPAGKPFKAHIAPDEHGMGLISWRLSAVAPGDVDGCDDDIDGCED
ncbi:hypothetical protein [Streptomyces catenulae]|uniref:Lipoprotein n=1 Tax=Streptomyces catenulae TaxID=66875 RepID=A0ABV2YVP6_9ACTN|nr:hypothetical protein [Streptomyces catenulae]